MSGFGNACEFGFRTEIKRHDQIIGKCLHFARRKRLLNKHHPLKSPEDWAILRGWVLYDGRCGLCTQSAERWRGTLQNKGFVFVNSLREEARDRSNAKQITPLKEMKLILIDGQTLGGAAAVCEIGRHLWWAKPFAWLGRQRFLKPSVEFLYRRVANNRHTLSRLLGYSACTNDACSVRPH